MAKRDPEISVQIRPVLNICKCAFQNTGSTISLEFPIYWNELAYKELEIADVLIRKTF